MFDSKLIKIINSGRCFLLVGSGPSCELGYPSWSLLAERVYEQVKIKSSKVDTRTYDKFLAEKKYPELLQQAEIDLGGRPQLITIVKTIFQPTVGMSSETYQLLAKWPFPVYLTTNFDNALTEYLGNIGVHFTTLRNTKSEVCQVRAESSHLVLKLHGDLEFPDTAIITSRNYDSIRSGSDYLHLRQKLTSIFSMCDVFIVGHSLTDSDLHVILDAAKETAKPDRPIYMALANATSGDIREYREKHNIHVISYDDLDHSHTQLKRILRSADHFISQRNLALPSTGQVDETEVEAATSLLLYRQTQAAAVKVNAAQDMFCPLILRALHDVNKPMLLSEIIKHRPVSLVSSNATCSQQLLTAIELLVETGQVNESNTKRYTLTSTGKTYIDELANKRRLEEEQAMGQFVLDLRAQFPKLDEKMERVAHDVLRDVLVSTFKNRGLELANMVIGGQNCQPNRFPDLFNAITSATGIFESPDLRACFIDVAGRFLLYSNEPQRKFIASLSQGFFLYHLAGLDPTCSRLRCDFIEKTAWFLDSSVFLPLLAKGCQNHEYAKDFITKLTACGTANFTTEKILREAWKHLSWAMQFIRNHGENTSELLLYATRSEYKQNLFIDGYISLAAEGEISTFAEYLDIILPGKHPSEGAICEACQYHGVQSLRLDKIDGFEQEDWGDLPAIEEEIKRKRVDSGTYRGSDQVQAEAEMLGIIRHIRSGKYILPVKNINLQTVYFVSHSNLLDRVNNNHEVTTWSPEAVYRYLSTLPGATVNPDLLQECMFGEFFNVGVQVIDRQHYLTFFGPAINQAKLSYEYQKDKYLKSTEEYRSITELDEAFYQTPDLEKPFFVTQMAWKTANSAEQKAKATSSLLIEERKKTEAAEKRTQKAEEERAIAEKARRRAESEAGRLRNLSDPKRQRKLQQRAKKRRK